MMSFSTLMTLNNQCRCLVGKLIYFTITGVILHFFHNRSYWTIYVESKTKSLENYYRISHYIRQAPHKGFSFMRYGNLTIDYSKYTRCYIDTRSTFRLLHPGVWKLCHLKKEEAKTVVYNIYRKFWFVIWNSLWSMNYDNQVAICIANNLTFHKKIKHRKVNCHFVKDVVISKKIPLMIYVLWESTCIFLLNHLILVTFSIFVPS